MPDQEARYYKGRIQHPMYFGNSKPQYFDVDPDAPEWGGLPGPYAPKNISSRPPNMGAATGATPDFQQMADDIANGLDVELPNMAGAAMQDEKISLPGDVTGPPPTAPSTYDFWGKLKELIGGEDGVSDEEMAYVQELFEGDKKWGAPRSAKAQRLMNMALTFKKLGYDDSLMELVGALFDMGYSAPKFSLSMFSSLLKPYGLGTSSGGSASSSKKSSSGTSDIDAMLAQLGL